MADTMLASSMRDVLAHPERGVVVEVLVAGRWRRVTEVPEGVPGEWRIHARTRPLRFESWWVEQGDRGLLVTNGSEVVNLSHFTERDSAAAVARRRSVIGR